MELKIANLALHSVSECGEDGFGDSVSMTAILTFGAAKSTAIATGRGHAHHSVCGLLPSAELQRGCELI